MFIRLATGEGQCNTRLNCCMCVCVLSGRQKFLEAYKVRRRFSQGAIQPIREILDEMEERQKEEEEAEAATTKKLTGKEKFGNVARKIKNVRIFLAKDQSEEEDFDDEKSNLEGNS